MDIKWCKYFIVLSLAFISISLSGQDTASDSNNPFPEPSESNEMLAIPLSRLEFQLSLYVLGFGLLLILLELYLVKIKNISPEDTIKFVIITIIIVSTLFLITAGYSNDQIAPAVGLLGTIAGYLLGRINPLNKNEN